MEKTHTLPKNTRHTKIHSDFKHIPHKSNNTLPSQHPAKPFRLKHPTSLNTTSLAASKSKPHSMLQIKNFRCCVVKEKFRNSFVCLKNIVFGKMTNFTKRYNLINEYSLVSYPDFV